MNKIIQAPLKKQYLIMKYNTPTFLLILGRIKKRQNPCTPIVTLSIYITITGRKNHPARFFKNYTKEKQISPDLVKTPPKHPSHTRELVGPHGIYHRNHARLFNSSIFQYIFEIYQ